MSMITNIGAINALSSFRLLNKQMEANQMQISTGKRVNEAKDDYVAWSAASHTKSDISTMSIVSKAMSKSKGLLDTTQAGISQLTNILDQMSTIIAQAGNKEEKNGELLQANFNSLREQIDQVVNSASFDGKSLLAGDPKGAEVLSSFSRRDGAVKIHSENIKSVNFTMEGRGFASSEQILDKIQTKAAGANANFVDKTSTHNEQSDVFTQTKKVGIAKKGGELQLTFGSMEADNFMEGDKIRISGTGFTAEVELTQNMLDSANFKDDVLAELNTQLNNNLPKTAESTLSGGIITLKNNHNKNAISSVQVKVDWDDTAGVMSSLDSIDVSNLSANLGNYAELVGMAKQSVIDAGARFGMVQNRLDGQNDYMKSLMETMEKGMSALVDADMERVSADMQSLQIRQQLAVQALSVSNQKESTLLSLFR